jgi:hypothetical protein
MSDWKEKQHLAEIKKEVTLAKFKSPEVAKASEDFKPTSGMAASAKRGLEWRKEFNRGGTLVGVARARDVANNKNLSESTVLRMYSFFARHAVDAEAEGWNAGEKGYPSAGKIAHELWGGNSGRSWSKAKRNKIMRDRKNRKG